MIRIEITSDLPALRADLTKRIPSALRTLENAVLTSAEPYVPYRTGELCRSGHPTGNGHVGQVTWSAPHASECYYARRSFGKKFHPLAVSRWFEAAKAADLEKWRSLAASALTGERRNTDG